MSELRWHPFRREWVITATHRQDRTFFPPDDYCPLCPTGEDGFPTEIPAATYDVAVFENKFPSLRSPATEAELMGSQIIPVLPSEGVCEVICYSPLHDATMADLPLEQVRKIVRVWKERYETLSERSDVGYVFIFENKGREIGVTLSHPHGQIYGYPFVPAIVQTRLGAERAYFEANGGTLQQAWLAEELQAGVRIVKAWKHWVALVPAFARYPYEVHIVPMRAACDLAAMSAAELDDLAAAIKDTAERYDRLFGFSMPYIMSLHGYPAQYSGFVVEFTPPYRTADKLKYLAGSEAACGAFINDTLPENTAATLRKT